jgi:hypothetical protein
MKRATTTILVLLLLGAIVNVLVAWTFALTVALPWEWEYRTWSAAIEEDAAGDAYALYATQQRTRGTVVILVVRNRNPTEVRSFRNSYWGRRSTGPPLP